MTTRDTSSPTEDLRYVRSVLDHAERGPSPASIYYLWAILCLVGFALVDLRPTWTGPFWLIAGPGGGVVSLFLGRRHGLATGQGSKREAIFHTLHWTGMMVAIFLAFPLAATGALNIQALPSLILLMVAFGYYTAGIYLDRKLLYVGIVVGLCYGATFFMRGWPWTHTFAGLVISASLVVSAHVGKSRVSSPARAEDEP